MGPPLTLNRADGIFGNYTVTRELQSGAARPTLTICAERQFDTLVNLKAG
jgi:hypothetical protein